MSEVGGEAGVVDWARCQEGIDGLSAFCDMTANTKCSEPERELGEEEERRELYRYAGVDGHGLMLDTIDAEVWLTKRLPASRPLSAAGLSVAAEIAVGKSCICDESSPGAKGTTPNPNFLYPRLNPLWRGALRGPSSAYAG